MISHLGIQTYQISKYFTTHSGSLYLAGLIVGALEGRSREELLSEGFCPVTGLWDRNPLASKIATIAVGSFKRRNPPDLRGTGYVVDSLEAALWAFHHSQSYEEGALLAVNLGDDADTTGAVYGQLAGAYYGSEGIPDRWLEKLAYRALIEQLADGLRAGLSLFDLELHISICIETQRYIAVFLTSSRTA
jgi:ADP-ribosyl-[dinitrogen reductase] hydrolase